MRLPIYQIDAFAGELFAGNPAAVVPLERWIDDALLQSIATENNLSETAFFIPVGAHYELRWFTPSAEVRLCGHATLASAHVIFNELGDQSERLHFETLSGTLSVEREGETLLMDFPARLPELCPAPDGIGESLGKEPVECYMAGDDYLMVFDRESDIPAINPDFRALGTLDCRGVIVTAPGESADFVSRFFAPSVGVPEDPVTGSAHCALAPYWAERLGKKRVRGFQLSRRGGEVICEVRDDRVGLAGRTVKYLEGHIFV